MKTLVVVQARMSSSRLPGKALLPLAGAPLLVRQVERIRAARRSFACVVATSDQQESDPIARCCQRYGLTCFRGHPSDLLDRHYRAALAFGADAVVKIPSDCPLIDFRIIDRVLGQFEAHAGEVDFVSNLHPPSYPDGNDVEVMTIEALSMAHREAERAFEREHTTPFIWQRPERFRLLNVASPDGVDRSRSERWTIDYPEDYQMIHRVYQALWDAAGEPFSMQDVLAYLEAHPQVRDLNQRWAGTSWHDHHKSEIKNAHLLGQKALAWQGSTEN